jgi:xanthine dehydrogenase molybdopterin-binding subunit B
MLRCIWSISSVGQIEGSFIQGIGFFIYEEYLTSNDGLMISSSTWDYKIPSVDTIPKQFNAEVLNTGYQKHRVLSSKGMANKFMWFVECNMFWSH